MGLQVPSRLVPKCRRKVLYGQLRKHLGQVLHDLAGQKESKLMEGHLQADHVHMLVSIPPKYSVAQVVGFIKGKSAIHIARTFGRRKNYTGKHFWARGYFVSTVGANEAVIREYIQQQEKEDARLDQLGLFAEDDHRQVVRGSFPNTALSGSQIQATGSAGGNVTLPTSHHRMAPTELNSLDLRVCLNCGGEFPLITAASHAGS